MVAVTAVAGYEYIKQIRLAHKEYLKAKDFIEDIVLSFDRELKRESAKFDTIVSKVEGSYSTADVSYRKAESAENKIEPLQYQVESLAESYQAISQTINQNLSESTQNSTSILGGLSGLEAKFKDIEATQETLKTRIATFEEQVQKLAAAPPPQLEAREIVLPPIPIKRDKALAALTDTEIQVLEILSKGPKTAPEIKERVHLSREHTARLMKKLYEDGYLEREAGKIPFRYSLKKEMEALLHKAEGPAAI